MPSRRQTGKRKSPPKRAKRSLLASRPSLPRPHLELEAHHVDILGLALIALGIFLAGVAYTGLSGGTLGNGAVTAMRFVLGALGYAIPAALVAGGALVLLRDVRPSGRPLRTGAVCLVAAITLALAAGTFGIGPGRVPPAAFWHPAAFEARGGIVGQAELWVSSHLVSLAGAHILAVFLLIAGVILVTGATLASVIRMTGAGMAGTSRALKRSTGELRSAAGRRPLTAAGRSLSGELDDGFGGEPEPLLPPEVDTSELVVRATHVEAPANMGDARSGTAEDGEDAAPDETPAPEIVDNIVDNHARSRADRRSLPRI